MVRDYEFYRGLLQCAKIGALARVHAENGDLIAVFFFLDYALAHFIIYNKNGKATKILKNAYHEKSESINVFNNIAFTQYHAVCSLEIIGSISGEAERAACGRCQGPRRPHAIETRGSENGELRKKKNRPSPLAA